MMNTLERMKATRANLITLRDVLEIAIDEENSLEVWENCELIKFNMQKLDHLKEFLEIEKNQQI